MDFLTIVPPKRKHGDSTLRPSESPIILTDCIPIEIPKFMASKHAYASAANREEMLL
ncbi:hypothetical protein PVK06_049164 [Gossypium arboreum]|uniref:Uncharacterized protein n=1 Tax=Gossypium arboreum TaxID=29729 RepID=A0ABR0MJY5_GOSAR|nr:hypothetical protein PVK06_049164 [Gossypium arboreum]